MDARQLVLEQGAVDRGLERYWADVTANRAIDREFDMGPGRTFATEVLERFIPEVRALQREARRAWMKHLKTGLRLQGWETHICALPAAELAYITCRTVLSNRGRDPVIYGVGVAIGNRCNLQLNWNEARVQERARRAENPEYRNRIQLMKSRVKTINPRSVRAWLRRLDDLQYSRWPNELRVKIGVLLIHRLLEACPDLFDITYDLIVLRSNRCDKHHRHPIYDKGDRTVLHLCRRQAFGVNIAYFL